jgi:hypothetical protein
MHDHAGKQIIDPEIVVMTVPQSRKSSDGATFLLFGGNRSVLGRRILLLHDAQCDFAKMGKFIAALILQGALELIDLSADHDEETYEAQRDKRAYLFADRRLEHCPHIFLAGDAARSVQDFDLIIVKGAGLQGQFGGLMRWRRTVVPEIITMTLQARMRNPTIDIATGAQPESGPWRLEGENLGRR